GTGIDLEDNPGLNIAAESLKHYLELVGPNRDAGDDERPVRRSDSVARESRLGLRHGDGGAWQDATARVLDDAGNLGTRAGLRERQRSRQHDEQPSTRQSTENALHTPPLHGGRLRSFTKQRV